MEAWIKDIIEQFGYVGVFTLIALENLFPPIPSEVILTFSGFMTTTTDLSVIGVIFSSTLGSLVGAVLLYGLGMKLTLNRMELIIRRWGHVLRISMDDLHRTNAWFTKYGAWTVFFCRFIPLIRSLISIPAGMVRMNFGLFMLNTTLGTLIWNTVLVYIGTWVGVSWKKVAGYMDVYSNVVYAAILIMLVLGVAALLRRRNAKKQNA